MIVVEYFSAFEKFIPWIALILLGYIGGHMIYESVCPRDSEEEETGVGFWGIDGPGGSHIH